MTVIRPNSVSGITSITAQANEINFFRSNGTLAGLQLNGVNFNTTTGVSTFNNLDVGGVLTYQDVTNVDSVGIITARSTIDAQGDVSIADKIIHTGDTNTAIRFPAVDTISFETSGSERVRISSSGETLVTGTLKINDGSTSANRIALGNSGDLIIYNGSNENHIYGSTNQDLIFSTNTTERLRITSDGKISTPLGTTTRIGVADRTSGTGAGGSLCVTAGSARGSGQNSGDLILASGRGNNSANAGAIKFGYNNGADGTSLDNEWLRITSGGNLRLGLNSVAEQTDSAHYIMTLTGKSGQTGAGAIAFKDPSANTDGFIFADSGNLFITADYSNATADSSIRFRVDGSSEKLRIDSSGNMGLGIGGAISDARFRIKGANNTTSSFNDGLMVTSNNETVYKKYSWMGIETQGGIIFSEATSSLGETMRIDTSGNTKFNSGFGSVTTVYGCRAWVKLNQTGTQTINGSGGVSSITDLGTGHTQVNFATTMPDINYAMVGAAQQSGNPSVNFCYSLCMQGRNTGNANFIYRPNATSDTKQDQSQVDIAFFR